MTSAAVTGAKARSVVPATAAAKRRPRRRGGLGAAEGSRPRKAPPDWGDKRSVRKRRGRDDVPRLKDQLDHHWAQVVAECVRADDPLAFGIDKLRHARTTLATDLRSLADRLPADRGGEWEQARVQLTEALRERHDAEQALAYSRAKFQDSSRRRWGRRDRAAVASSRERLALAEQYLEQKAAAERELRDRLAAITSYQHQRQEAIARTGLQRKDVETALAQLDDTRPDRALALVDEPPSHLVERLGPPPGSPAGRAVWCHYALGIEATLDSNDGVGPHWTGCDQQAQAAREEIVVADRLLETDAAPGPTEWANLAGEAAILREHVQRTAAVRRMTQQLLKASAQWGPGRPGWTPEERQEPSL